jgi:2-polyprenyl-3-methyl-5-hydroxy-6-metoxy-1,4-benzoquinol methylase
MTDEYARLEKVSHWYDAPDGFKTDWGQLHSRLIGYRYRTLKPFFRGTTALELGIADGQMTARLLESFAHVTGLEASTKFIVEVEARFPGARERLRLVHTLFEEFQTTERFDTVLVMHVLEHVEDPVGLLRLAGEWVAPGGVLLINVPNARSLHRLAAVKMGLLEKPHSFNDTDRSLGHRRVYYPEQLSNDVAAAGLKLAHLGGIFLKPLANKQIERDWTPEMIDAFYELGDEFPHIAAEIYAACTPEQSEQ